MRRTKVLVDLLFLAWFAYELATKWGVDYYWIDIAGFLIWASNLAVHVRQLLRAKPSKNVQLLRGARLALQHFKDYYYAVNRADLEYFTEYHVREYRRLTYAGRLAYNHWRPARRPRKQVTP